MVAERHHKEEKILNTMGIPFITGHVYNAPLQKVWQALTETDKMKQWYFPQLIHFEPVVGCRFKFKDDGSPYKKEWTVK